MPRHTFPSVAVCTASVLALATGCPQAAPPNTPANPAAVQPAPASPAAGPVPSSDQPSPSPLTTPTPGPVVASTVTVLPDGTVTTSGGGGGAAPTPTPVPHTGVVITPATSLPPTAPLPPPDPGFTAGQKMLYVSNRDGNQEVYLADADAGNPVRLTTDAGNDLFPSFSGDRKEVAWCSDRGAGIYAIYRMWTDGTHLVRLTFGTLPATQPAFSPDGSKIAFVRWTGASTSVIAVMSRDGSNETALTPDGGQAFSPAWSADGTQLVFGSNHATPGIPILYKMPATGGTLTAISPLNGAYYPVGKASWSPDGARIAYSSVQSNGAPTLTLINADGLGRITLSSSGDTDPVWSPDGTTLLFTTLASGTSQLARINADGSGLTSLTTGPATYAQSAW